MALSNCSELPRDCIIVLIIVLPLPRDMGSSKLGSFTSAFFC